jgi:hypothetical protein
VLPAFAEAYSGFIAPITASAGFGLNLSETMVFLESLVCQQNFADFFTLFFSPLPE